MICSFKQMSNLESPFENLLITPVNSGPFFIDALFKKKFADPAPDYGNPVICFLSEKHQPHYDYLLYEFSTL